MYSSFSDFPFFLVPINFLNISSDLRNVQHSRPESSVTVIAL